MTDKMFLLSCDTERASTMAEPYRARGWDVSLSSPARDGLIDDLVDAGPLAVVSCLDEEDGDAIRELVSRVADHPGSINPILVFYGGTETEIAATKQVAPYGIYVNPDEVGWVLKHLSVNY